MLLGGGRRQLDNGRFDEHINESSECNISSRMLNEVRCKLCTSHFLIISARLLVAPLRDCSQKQKKKEKTGLSYEQTQFACYNQSRKSPEGFLGDCMRRTAAMSLLFVEMANIAVAVNHSVK